MTWVEINVELFAAKAASYRLHALVGSGFSREQFITEFQTKPLLHLPSSGTLPTHLP
jgi:hypothetical protein